MVKLFLDDIRVPGQCLSYMQQRIGNLSQVYQGEWMIVRNYDEFVKAVKYYAGQISHVSFDHDLAEGHYHEAMYRSKEEYENHLLNIKEKTGYDCALFLKEFYDQMNEDSAPGDTDYPMPLIFIHTMNPVGLERIKSVFGKN